MQFPDPFDVFCVISRVFLDIVQCLWCKVAVFVICARYRGRLVFACELLLCCLWCQANVCCMSAQWEGDISFFFLLLLLSPLRQKKVGGIGGKEVILLQCCSRNWVNVEYFLKSTGTFGKDLLEVPELKASLYPHSASHTPHLFGV